MAKNYFKSYIWLLETLQSRGPLTLNQIKELWQRSSINEDQKELATRTFANHVAAIADIFGIDIVCDRRDNTYRIDNEGDLGGNGLRDWLMEALSLNNLINESASLRSRLLFESEPSSHRFLKDIIRAIRDERMLEVNYQGFKMDGPRGFLLEPFCLKEYKRRWYLFARKHGIDKEPHSFALDRMNSVTVSEKAFSVPKSFDARSFFSTHYGALKYDGEKPAHIRLKASAHQANYFRTLPLHSSQKELEKNENYSIFAYYLTPNYDFIHDVLSYGDAVEVLEPVELRKRLATEIALMKIKY
jgi:predicted DNA-binding transcriptional regulator YafY